MKKIAAVLIFLALLFVLEPVMRGKLTFAVTYFNNPNINIEEIENQYPIAPNSQAIEAGVPQAARAPEPATLFLFLGGITSFILRFVRKSFEKIKRYLDVSLSIFALAIASPILVFAAILIKLNSKGPVIYKQDRVGKNGRIFEIYKLRTMPVNAEAQTGAVWAKEDDPRATSVGRVLRKTHLDEIPQLFNVLKGEMSIVGPRPERPEIVRDLKTFILDYEQRLQVKPGITGLAQVWHKYDETIDDVKKKIKYDLLYIRKMCLLADLKILGNTFVLVLTGKGVG